MPPGFVGTAEPPLIGQGPEKTTARTEAFSDGVFAFAITLLVLDLKDPALSTSTNLFQGLLAEWPAFFAFATSFATVLIMWVNHHNMFRPIRWIDNRLMFLNGLLLLFVVLTPFTTSLVADHLLAAEAGPAAGVYAGTFFVLSLVWNGSWRYVSRAGLLGPEFTDRHVRQISRQYLVGPTAYGIAILVSFVSGLASVAVVLLVAAFFAVTGTLAR